MRLEEVRETVRQTAENFFSGACVAWAEQPMTTPIFPYVTLKFGDLQRNMHALTDGDADRAYQCSIPIEINLYTKGRKVSTKNNTVTAYANTAVSDMNDFFKYLDSEYITDSLMSKGIAVVLNPPIRDLTDLQNDSRYRYRAMAEATVTFVDEANGLYGLAEMAGAPNASGGGTEEMKEAPSDYIEDVEITDVSTEGE